MSVDKYGIEAPPADLYQFSRQITAGISGFPAVTDADIEAFRALGFMIIHKAIDRAAIEAARAGLRDLMLRRDTNNIMFESAVGPAYADLPDDKRLDSVRKMMPIIPYDGRLKAAAENAELLAVIERIIGEAPVLSQDMALLKPPRIGREKPWHQDMAYFDYPADATIVGAWIALDEALPENGCMMVVPGSHHSGPTLHWTRRDWQICDTEVQVGRSVAIPLLPGGCLLFHCLLHHGTPPSRSSKRRWALQFHYRPANVAPLPNSDHRMSVFGAEGKDATC